MITAPRSALSGPVLSLFTAEPFNVKPLAAQDFHSLTLVQAEAMLNHLRDIYRG